MWRAALALLVTLSLSVPAAAGPYENGVAAYATGDYATAVSLWTPLAEQGHAEAQISLGVMHENGEGVGGHDEVKNEQQRHENNRGIQGRHQGEDRMVGFIVVFAVRKIGPAIHTPKFRRRMKQKTVGDILK